MRLFNSSPPRSQHSHEPQTYENNEGILKKKDKHGPLFRWGGGLLAIATALNGITGYLKEEFGLFDNLQAPWDSSVSVKARLAGTGPGSVPRVALPVAEVERLVNRYGNQDVDPADSMSRATQQRNDMNALERGIAANPGKDEFSTVYPTANMLGDRRLQMTHSIEVDTITQPEMDLLNSNHADPNSRLSQATQIFGAGVQAGCKMLTIRRAGTLSVRFNDGARDSVSTPPHSPRVDFGVACERNGAYRYLEEPGSRRAARQPEEGPQRPQPPLPKVKGM